VSERRCDLVVIGGGPTGLAASIKAWDLRVKKIILMDESNILGGVLPQCIHPGFGLHYFKKDLTGPEFAALLEDKLKKTGVEVWKSAYAANIEVKSRTEKKIYGYRCGKAFKIRCKAIVYAAGCRERTRFEAGILGDRPASIWTAGEAQTLMDLYGVLPGRKIVVVGSGDIGLIMARRLALEGAEVKAVVEILPYPGGLTRNIIQCLDDFGIPLSLGCMVSEVKGSKRVEEVKLVKVDEKLNPIKGTEFSIECDTVILAVGLRPRSEIIAEAGALINEATGGSVVNDWLETTIPGIFAAGNVLIINDLVDYAAEQGERAAESAAKFIQEGLPKVKFKQVSLGQNMRLMVPQLVSCAQDVVFYGRVNRPDEKVSVRFEEVGRAFKLPIVRPSEMLRFKLSAEGLSKLQSEKLTVNVVRT
jgi:NADPH-dependent 2,4-dienoyl-CoA reductase/sulfur reductase-like enzyme